MKLYFSHFLLLSATFGLLPLAQADQTLSISVGQTLNISGNCPGQATLTRNRYQQLMLDIQNEKCSRIDTAAGSSKLDGYQVDFRTDIPLIVSNGELISIHGTRSSSEATNIVIYAPAPTPTPTPTPTPVPDHYKNFELVPVTGIDQEAAALGCTDMPSSTYKNLGPGQIVGLGFGAVDRNQQIVIACDRGGVVVPAIGIDEDAATAACNGQSAHFPDLPNGVKLGLPLEIGSDSVYVGICKRPVTHKNPDASGLPSTMNYFDGPSRTVSASYGWIQLDSYNRQACDGRVRLTKLQPVSYLDYSDPVFRLEVQGSLCSAIKIGFIKINDRFIATADTVKYNLIQTGDDSESYSGYRYGQTMNIRSSSLANFSSGGALDQISLVLFADHRNDTQRQAFEKLTISIP